MRITKVRDTVAAIVALLLVLALAVGILLGMGVHVPFISEFLGR